ncbi:MAG: sugar phosphate isomerase/epimerase [candidate division KSB1 bacterium]|nr:sugar phosphate isomerase/epimerase [candidate division KSB1 bacterium]
MKRNIAILLLAMIGLLITVPVNAENTDTAYDGWKLAVQAYSFKEFTFMETLEKLDSLGVRYLEAYSGQTLCDTIPDVRFGPQMPDSLKEWVRGKLEQAGIQLINFGVVGLSKDKAANVKVFEFANYFGIGTIISEPPFNALKLIDRQCKEYDIRVAIHNHPKPSRYWNPQIVLKALKGRSSYLGVCGDTGHWMRSGIRPETAVDFLGNRLMCFHLKDLNAFGNKDAHDVHWGLGELGFKEFLAQLHNMGFHGSFSVEYEYHWLDSLPEIRQCVDAFNRIAATLPSETSVKDDEL